MEKVGRHVISVITILGPPEQVMVAGGKKYYIWNDSYEKSAGMFTESYTEDILAPMLNVGYVETNAGGVSKTVSCKLIFGVNYYEIIDYTKVSGDGCDGIYDELK